MRLSSEIAQRIKLCASVRGKSDYSETLRRMKTHYQIALEAVETAEREYAGWLFRQAQKNRVT